MQVSTAQETRVGRQTVREREADRGNRDKDPIR